MKDCVILTFPEHRRSAGAPGEGPWSELLCLLWSREFGSGQGSFGHVQGMDPAVFPIFQPERMGVGHPGPVAKAAKDIDDSHLNVCERFQQEGRDAYPGSFAQKYPDGF